MLKQIKEKIVRLLYSKNNLKLLIISILLKKNYHKQLRKKSYLKRIILGFLKMKVKIGNSTTIIIITHSKHNTTIITPTTSTINRMDLHTRDKILITTDITPNKIIPK